MRVLTLSLLALVTLTGCFSIHAHLPEDMVRHMAREDGVDLAAICSHDGRTFSEGAIVCMDSRRAICDSAGRWDHDGSC